MQEVRRDSDPHKFFACVNLQLVIFLQLVINSHYK